MCWLKIEMEEEEIEPDIREQMFHSTVREYIVSSSTL